MKLIRSKVASSTSDIWILTSTWNVAADYKWRSEDFLDLKSVPSKYNIMHKLLAVGTRDEIQSALIKNINNDALPLFRGANQDMVAKLIKHAIIRANSNFHDTPPVVLFVDDPDNRIAAKDISYAASRYMTVLLNNNADGGKLTINHNRIFSTVSQTVEVATIVNFDDWIDPDITMYFISKLPKA